MLSDQRFVERYGTIQLSRDYQKSAGTYRGSRIRQARSDTKLVIDSCARSGSVNTRI